MDLGLPIGLLIALGAVVLYMAASVKIVREYERGILFLFGKYVGVKPAGLRFVFVPFYRMVVVDLRIVAEDVPPQDIITRDNVSARVNAVIYYRVVDPEKAVLQVEDFRYATSQLAQTSLRSIVGGHQLDDLLAEREKVNTTLQKILDEQTDAWGIKVSSVELKHVDLPQDMQRAMARQAEAERERRARIIAAEGEYQAAEKLTGAARILATQPETLQLRFLQTAIEIAADKNSTMVFPLPLELLRAFAPQPAEGAVARNERSEEMKT